jgi:hypothetical protein
VPLPRVHGLEVGSQRPKACQKAAGAKAGAGREIGQLGGALALSESHVGDPLEQPGVVAVAPDPAGNLKPRQRPNTERIDGIVALIMAIARVLVAYDEPQLEYSMLSL